MRKKIPRERKVVIGVSVPESVDNALRQMAEQQLSTKSTLVRHFAHRALKAAGFIAEDGAS